jgi:hypothetical protein
MASPEATAGTRWPTTAVESRGSAFGLDVRTADEWGWAGPVAPASSARRDVRVLFDAPGTLTSEWRESRALELMARPGRPGRPGLRIERAEGGEYRVWAPGHGRHLISADGTVIRSAVPHPPDRRWLRLFLAQPLPLAAALQGLELFHASAVQVGEAVLSFIASSGTGKTSLAAQLVGRGARFVTDDILALEIVDGAVVAYPGPRWLCLDEEESRSMTAAERLALGPILGKSDKLHFAPPTAGAPARVASIFYLRRDHDVSKLEFSEIDVLEPSRLFSSLFLSYLDDPGVMVRTLDFCARFGRLVRGIEVRVPADIGSRALADEVLAFASRELG